MRRKKEVVVISAHVVFGILIALSLFLTVLIAILISKNIVGYGDEVEKEENLLRRYRSIHYDSHSEETSVGFVEMPVELSEYEFLSYEGSNGQYFLISNFEEDSFTCSGTCSCQGERRSSHVISRGLMYLVTATSSALAFERARDYMKDKCSREFGRECTEDSIITEVDDCYLSSITRFDFSDWKPKKKEEKSEEKKEKTKKMKKKSETQSVNEALFTCSGSCIPNRVETLSNDQKESIEKNKEECYSRRLEVLVSTKEFRQRQAKRDQVIGSDLQIAKIQFIIEHLTDTWCQSQSQSVKIDSEGSSVDLCMAPQLLSGGSTLESQFNEAGVECMSMESLGSLDCEHEHD